MIYGGWFLKVYKHNNIWLLYLSEVTDAHYSNHFKTLVYMGFVTVPIFPLTSESESVFWVLLLTHLLKAITKFLFPAVSLNLQIPF